MLLHYCLGHPSFSYIRRLFPYLFSKKESFTCEISLLAKHTCVPFTVQIYRPSRPFSLIHSDIWGPSRVTSISNKKWFISFIDDQNRVCWIYFLRDKSEVAQFFENFNAMIQTQYNSRIKFLRTNNGTEYFNSTLGNFILKNDMIHQSSCVNTPQQNEVFECKNSHLLKVTRSLLFGSNVSKHFWFDALLTACFLINCMPSKVMKFQTPLSTLQTFFPTSLAFSDIDLCVFGCSAFAHIQEPNRGKLDACSCKCMFLGYSSIQKGYWCYSPKKKEIFYFQGCSFY